MLISKIASFKITSKIDFTQTTIAITFVYLSNTYFETFLVKFVKFSTNNFRNFIFK